MTLRTAYRAEIERAAGARHLDPDLIEAMVLQESGGNTFAWNPEPAYRYLWNVREHRPFRTLTAAERASETPPRDFPVYGGDRDQEWWGQQASWGLLQVMGAVARERGFKGVYLPELCDPNVCLDIGCRHFALLVTWAEGDQWKAVAAYNGGRGNWNGQQPQAHAAKVQQWYARLRG